MHGIATLTIKFLLPVLLTVIGRVFPPSSLVKVTVTRIFLPAEIPEHMVRPVTFTVPGTCSDR